jgi:hypothetical protein
MSDFFSSEAGQFASLAKAFLEGARVLDAAQPENGRMLFRPTLALAGHGLELMLKACFHINGLMPPTKGKKGHDILALWAADVCEPIRGHLFVNARIVAEIDRASGQYCDVPHDDDVLPLIEEYVTELCKLHGRDRYPLRYPADKGQKAPRTPFLVKSLWRTADDLVKRPNEFELSRFRGLA